MELSHQNKDHIKTTPEQILLDHNPEVRAIAQQLRDLIRMDIPAVEEKAYPSWHGIGYRHPDSGYICGIFPLADSVKLGFEFGVLLPDPQGLLHGEGSQVRYLIFKATEEIHPGIIHQFLQAAINLPLERQVKLDMIKTATRPFDEHRPAGGSNS